MAGEGKFRFLFLRNLPTSLITNLTNHLVQDILHLQLSSLNLPMDLLNCQQTTVSKQKPLLKSSNPLKGLNNLFISYEKQNTKEAYNSNGNLERV